MRYPPADFINNLGIGLLLFWSFSFKLQAHMAEGEEMEARDGREENPFPQTVSAAEQSLGSNTAVFPFGVASVGFHLIAI